jgi:uncharacterized protein YjdB
VVNGVAAGTATITYALSGGCAITKTITVNALGAIAGGTSVCVGQSLALTTAAPGGIWTSNNPTRATIGSVSGMVNGIAAGSLSISYTIGACRAILPFTVNRLSAIGGNAAVCEGQTTALTNANSGGVWTSELPAVATIGSASATVTGVAAGTTIISYTLATGCTATRVQTVHPIAAITGSSTVCISTPTTLANTVGGGIWTSNNTTIARIGSATGIVTGVRSGYAIIAYTIPATGCRVTAPMTVNNCRIASDAADMATTALTLLPNPNTGNFKLIGSVSDEVVTITITDVMGRTIYTAQIAAANGQLNESISLPQPLATGVYVLYLRGETSSITTMFVVE